MSDRSEWVCGHHAGAMCAECYRLLAQRASELAVENAVLAEENWRLKREAAKRDG